MDKKELKSKAKAIKPILWIGKNGITDGLINELKYLLKRKKLVKIKLLRGFLEENDKKEVVDELVTKTDSELVEQVGFIIVLYRR